MFWIAMMKEGVFVNISGLEHEDIDVMDGLFGILDNAMNKINKIFRPRVLNVHVHTYNDEGKVIDISMYEDTAAVVAAVRGKPVEAL